MFAFDLLRVALAHRVRSNGQRALIDSGRIGVKVLQPKRLEYPLQLDTDCIGATPNRIGQDHPAQMVNGMPQPSLVRFAADKTPHLIHCCRLHATHFYYPRVQTTALPYVLVDRREIGRFFLLP